MRITALYLCQCDTFAVKRVSSKLCSVLMSPTLPEPSVGVKLLMRDTYYQTDYSKEQCSA